MDIAAIILAPQMKQVWQLCPSDRHYVAMAADTGQAQAQVVEEEEEQEELARLQEGSSSSGSDRNSFIMAIMASQLQLHDEQRRLELLHF